MTKSNESWRKATQQYIKAHPPQFGPLTESDLEQIADYMVDSWRLVAEVVWLHERNDVGMGCSFPADELLAAISKKLEGR
jgi:hypothetical protein